MRETLRLFRTNFTIVKDVFRKSGSLEAGHELDEADRFWGHVQRLLVNVSEDVRLIILFSFWVFDGSWPTFLSSLQPESHQFDIGVKRSLPIDLTDTGSTQDARSGKRTPTNGGFEILAQAMKSTAQEDEFTKHMIEGAKDQHKISLLDIEAKQLDIELKKVSAAKEQINLLNEYINNPETYGIDKDTVADLILNRKSLIAKATGIDTLNK